MCEGMAAWEGGQDLLGGRVQMGDSAQAALGEETHLRWVCEMCRGDIFSACGREFPEVYGRANEGSKCLVAMETLVSH